MVVLNKRAAGWIAFADGLAMLGVSLVALSLHETSIERVVHALERSNGDAQSVVRTRARWARPIGPTRAAISGPMRSWVSWLANVGVALCGGFVVVITFAMTQAGSHHISPRWIAFGVAIAAACIAFGSLVERAVHRTGRTADWDARGRLALIATATANLATAAALIVTMLVYSGTTARWLAFALGCGFAGISLLALAIHEITSERVHHELEIGEPAPGGAQVPAGAAQAG
jgi:hypothetical protein